MLPLFHPRCYSPLGDLHAMLVILDIFTASASRISRPVPCHRLPTPLDLRHMVPTNNKLWISTPMQHMLHRVSPP